ncbi:MAG: amino acid adenylation domain-containing protein, partial [Cyanobacteria bacterium J06558_2]
LVKVQGWSEISRGSSLFESLVVFENYAVDKSLKQRDTELEIERFHSFEKTNYPLTLIVSPDEELSFTLKSARYDSDTMARMAGHLETLLAAIAADLQQKLSDLPLLTEPEKQQLLVEWNNTAENYPQDKYIHQLFEKQVRKTPDAVALVFEDEQLTYRELNTRANQLAHHLQTLGVQPEVLVGICLERSLEMVVGLLAILKAGGAYVSLDPSYPPERIAYMLEDSQVPLLLTKEKLTTDLLTHRANVVFLDKDWNKIARESRDNVTSNVKAINLAYAIYTSGSTGKPKGVLITHKALLNLVFWHQETFKVTSLDKATQLAGNSFDASVVELWPYIAIGASLNLVKPELIASPVALRDWLVRKQITLTFMPTPIAENILNLEWPEKTALRILSTGGEKLKIYPSASLPFKLFDNYGPSENTVVTIATFIDHQIGNTVAPPIGRPIANTQVYLLDSNLQPVPIGVAGELYIAGVGLARGYLNRPMLTCQRFIPNPFSGQADERLYRSGDLARYLPNGEIEYISRIDHQVKVRGFRIELGEIEAVITQHPGVAETVVVAREESATNSKRLVAYVVAQEEMTLTISALREFLTSKLPGYMIPNALVTLEKLPLTPNGKVDRKALPAADISISEADFIPATTPTESLLEGIWAEILGLEQVGVNHNFFELGGHSLIATRVISQIRQVFDVELPLRTLFESPTIKELAKEVIRLNTGREIPPIKPINRSRDLPLSFAQQRLWFIAQLQPNNSAYNFSNALRLEGKLDIKVLVQTIKAIIQRHEVFRTNFSMVADEPVQVIHSKINFQLPIINLSGLSHLKQQREVDQLNATEGLKPFNLEQDALLRITLIQLNELEHVILFTMHHIISDGWSVGILVQEIVTLYQSFLEGKSSPLPELPIQYGDYAVWQREWLQGEVLDQQLDYWRQKLGSELPMLKLPYRQQQSVVKTNLSLSHSFEVSSELSLALRQLSRQTNTTLFMVILAALKTLLYRYTQQEDIVVGTDIANRNHAEIEGLIGFFVNILVLRTDLSDYPSFRELLARVKEVTLSAYAHQDLPFERLVQEIQPSRQLEATPLFQVLLVMNNVPTRELNLPGLTIIALENNVDNYAKFDLVLFINDTEAGIVGSWQFNSDLFDADAIAKLSYSYVSLLQNIVSEPDTIISNLAMIAPGDKEQQVEAKATQKQSKLNKFLKAKPQSNSIS